MLRAAGASEITVVEPSRTRRDKALSSGADVVVDRLAENLASFTAPPHGLSASACPR
jgi:threonine dehydrogenase-like Zn-dependent dehydrogenase